MTCFRLMIADVHAFTATSLATLTCRIFSIVPSADFRMAVAKPAKTAVARFYASIVSDSPPN